MDKEQLVRKYEIFYASDVNKEQKILILHPGVT